MKRRRWLLAIGGVCLVGPLVTNFYLDHSANVWLQEEIRLARAAGLTPTREDFAARSIPPEDNAAEEYRKARDFLKGLSDEDRALIRHYDRSQSAEELKMQLGPRFKGPSDLAALEAALDKWRPIMEHLVRAASMPALSFAKSPSDFPGISTYTVAEFAEGLDQDAASAARRGDYARALQNLRLAKKMAVQCLESQDDGNGAGSGILIGAQRMAIRLALSAPRNAEGDKGFGMIAAYLREPIPAPDLRQSLRLHSFWAIYMAETLASDPKELGLKPDDIDWQVKAAGLVNQRLSMEAQDLHLLREAILSMPPRGMDWEKEGEVMAKLDHDLVEKSSLYAKYVIARYARMWPRNRTLSGDVEMWRRLATVLCKLMEVRRKTGAYPSAIPDLGKDSIDGYSGMPFKYALARDGFDLYGYGPDRTDNGGKADDDMCAHVHGASVTFSRLRF